jgi:hypothetical protein
MWVTIVPGQVIKFNLFDPKKATGLKTGCVVDVEGLGASVNLYMYKPNPKYQPNAEPEPRVGFNYNTTGITYLRVTHSPYRMFQEIQKVAWCSTEPTYVNVEFDVSLKGKPQDLRTIQGVEVPSWSAVPLDRYVDFEQVGGRGKAHVESLPAESVSDFAMQVKDKEEGQSAAPADGEEAKEPMYPVWRARVSYLPYQNDPVKELQEGSTHSYNLVCFTRMMDTIGVWGTPRASELGPIMEVHSLPAVALCQFDSKNTVGNKYNLTRAPEEPCAGNVFFEVKAIAADLRGYLMTRGFNPSMEWFQKKFDHKKQHGVLINLDNRYPHCRNPFHDMVPGASFQRPQVYDIVCLNDFEGYANFMFPEEGSDEPAKWELRVLTSQWFSQKQKHSKEGQDDQDAILQQIGKLPQSEADACLDRAAGAPYELDSHATMIMYAVKRHEDQRAVETI